MERSRWSGRTGLLWAALLVVAIAVGCGPGVMPIRYGSLEVSERPFLYGHGVETFTLANGLVVALVPDAHANLVSVDVRYRVGASADPEGKTGLAHLVEHLTFEQRAAPGEPTLSDRLALAALGHNAATRWDATHYRAVALADQLTELLAIEAARMSRGCAGLDAEAFAHEREVVEQELTERGRSTLLHGVLRDVYGETHRYGSGIGGTDVQALTLDDVCGFVDAHYAPNRAILVLSGRFDAEPTRALLAQYFAEIPRRDRAPIRFAKPLVLTGTTSERHADTEEAAALIMFPAAQWGSAASFDEQLIEYLVMRDLSELAAREAWITGVEAGRLGGIRDGANIIAIAVDDPARLDRAIDQVFKTIDALPFGERGLQLGVAASQRRTELFSAFESITERGDHCADYLQFTGHGAFHLKELEALQVIETDMLQARARRLTRKASHIVRVLPSKQTGRRAARPTLQTVAIDMPVWRASVDPGDAMRPLPPPAPRAPRQLRELRLANGLRVIMADGFTQPVVEARMVFPVGDVDLRSPQLPEAAATLLEPHVRMQSLKDHFVVDWVVRLGAQLTSAVDEATTFTVRGSSAFADWHLWRLHLLLENGGYDEADLTKLRADAADRAARRARDTERAWRRAIREALYGADHPYARELDLAAISALDRGDLQDFREAHYRASGATLIIVGQFDPEKMTKHATELFGAWPGDPPPPAVAVPAMQPARGPVWLAHTDPDAAQVQIALAFAATSARQPSRAARAVVIEMLRRRLEQVRTRLGASYGIDVDFRTTPAGDSVAVEGYIDAARTGEVLRVMQAALDDLRTGDPELAADFVRARRAALARALADPMVAGSVADELEAAVTRQRALDDAAALPAEIAATTLAEARAVIAADLQAARTITLLSGREADVHAAYAAAGIAKFQRVAVPAPAVP